jgi:sugar diacid utilization regulator
VVVLGYPLGDISEAHDREITVRDLLCSLRALQVLSMVMTECRDEDEILALAVSAIPSLGRGRAVAIWLDGAWHEAGFPTNPLICRTSLTAAITDLGAEGGLLPLPELPLAWAYSLSRPDGASGLLIARWPTEPEEHEHSLLQALAQQTAVALANARLHARERESSAQLRITLDIHERLTRVAAAGEGLDGIARAVHELTGHSVAIEDQFGNLQVWAGPGRPDPYPEVPPTQQEQLLRRARLSECPVREGDRLVVLAHPRADILGVLALIDPTGTAGETELIALEHGGTVLAMELARLRTVAEAELRLGRDLLEDLLAGTDLDSVRDRGRALGYDLGQVHRVVVIESQSGARGEDYVFSAVRRSARDLDIGSLVLSRAGTVVILACRDGEWDQLRVAIQGEVGEGTCRVGVGGVSLSPRDIGRSYREAQLALKIQRRSPSGNRAVVFDELGAFRILADVENESTLEQYLRDWLGALMDHDERRNSELLTTLAAYLECGGSYDSTAKALSVHRNTLRYRLERIREISGHDLSDPDTRFNLQLATRARATLSALR